MRPDGPPTANGMRVKPSGSGDACGAATISRWQRISPRSRPESWYRRAFEVASAWYGKDHPQVALIANNLGTVLAKRDRPDEGEPLIRQAIRVVRRALGPSHPQLAPCRRNLAPSPPLIAFVSLGARGLIAVVVGLLPPAIFSSLEGANGISRVTPSLVATSLAQTSRPASKRCRLC